MNIRKSLLAGICLLGISAFGADIPNAFFFDMEYGATPDFKCYDLDGNLPSQDLGDYGFEVGDAWISHYVDSEDNWVMASTSWYEKAGKSNDWLILPAVEVSGDFTLSWKAKSNHNRLKDGYSVYVSTEGDSPETFDTTNPVFKIDGEDNVWRRHSLDLSAFQGRKIWIAFVNDSYDCSVLWIDDIRGGLPSPFDISLKTSPLLKPDKTLVVQGTVTNISEETRGNVLLQWMLNGEHGEFALPAQSLNPGESLDFEIDTEISIPGGTESELEVYIIDGYSRSDRRMPIYSRYKRVLAEEVTGTWCMYCIRGIVYSKMLKDMYPESSVCVAYHSDVMTVPYFTDKYASYINTVMGLPAAGCNRDPKYNGDPDQFLVNYEQIQNEPFKGSLELKVENLPDNIISAHADVIVRENLTADYSITYQVIENDVNVPGDSEYNQSNAYAGGSHGEMGGYENLPSVIPSALMFYQDVVRTEISDFYGVEGSLPSFMKKGTPYSHSYEFSVTDDILVPENCEVVAVLVDRKTGIALNCARAPLIVNQETSGIETLGNHYGEITETGRYSFSGMKLDADAKGWVIIRYSDGSSQKKFIP